jgi:hypothetical protein
MRKMKDQLAVASPTDDNGFYQAETIEHFSELNYLLANPDVARAVRDGTFKSGADHWVMLGQHEGRSLKPNQDILRQFDAVVYLEQNPDVAETVAQGMFASAWEHFIYYGHGEGRVYYLPPSDSGSEELRGNAAESSFAGDNRGSEVQSENEPEHFSEVAYLLANPDVARAVGEGVFRSGAEHWAKHGRSEGRRLKADDDVLCDFDAELYLKLNGDVATAVADDRVPSALQHFIYYGHGEGRLYRLPAQFDETTYLQLHPDVANAVAQGKLMSGGEHFARYGHKEQRIYRRPMSTEERMGKSKYLNHLLRLIRSRFSSR